MTETRKMPEDELREKVLELCDSTSKKYGRSKKHLYWYVSTFLWDLSREGLIKNNVGKEINEHDHDIPGL